MPRRSYKLPLAVGVGAIGVGAVAIWLATRSDHPATDDRATPTAALVPKPPPAPPPKPSPPPDPRTAATPGISAVLEAFSHWAPDHAGAPCPTVDTLGVAADDPWGHALRVTCTDQPGDQIVGVLSSGPDGTFETDDDIASWQLARDVTDVVRGARWVVSPKPVAKPPANKPHHRPIAKHVRKPVVKKSTKPKSKPKPTVILDDNGIPISR